VVETFTVFIELVRLLACSQKLPIQPYPETVDSNIQFHTLSF